MAKRERGNHSLLYSSFLFPFVFSAGVLAWSRIFVFLPFSMYVLLMLKNWGGNEHNYKIIR